MTKPLVSICIPTFNRANHITDALNYAIQQTYSNVEILVVDNCSTDSTMQICQQFKQKDSRISIYQNDTNIGACANLNRCVELAKGEYIKFLLSDDIILPTCVERMMEIFEKFPTVKLVACREDRIDNVGTVVSKDLPPIETGLISGRKTIKDNLYSNGFFSNFIATPSGVLIKTIDFASGFDPSMHWALDLELWLRILLLGGDYYRIDEPLALARDHKGSSTTVVEDTLVYIIHDILRLRNQFADFMAEEGVSAEEWTAYIDKLILDYLSNRLQTLSPEVVSASTNKFISMVGHNKTEEMVNAMLTVIFYLSTVLTKPVSELNYQKAQAARYKAEAIWYKDEAEKLAQTINSMTASLPWKIAKPLRTLKAKLAGLTK